MPRTALWAATDENGEAPQWPPWRWPFSNYGRGLFTIKLLEALKQNIIIDVPELTPVIEGWDVSDLIGQETGVRGEEALTGGGHKVIFDLSSWNPQLYASEDFAMVFPNYDTDGDGIFDHQDNCHSVQNEEQIDSDEDDIGDVCDNWAATFNLDQFDSDSDGVGDACEEVATVPNIVGLAQADAELAVADTGLVVGIITTENRPTVAAGHVISQSPPAGTEVTLGSSIALVISSGLAQIPVPVLVGETQSDAQSAILAGGLVVGAVTHQHHSTVPYGQVISQNPPAGTEVDPGSAVDLVVSIGPPIVSVPDVVGMRQTAAEAVIVSAGLAVGDVSTTSSPTLPAGNVISQAPTAGTEAPEGSKVDLVVSSGPPVTVPNVVGLSQSDAQTAITDAGLVVGNIAYENSAGTEGRRG